MLRPARMKRVQLLILEKDEKRVTRALGRLKLLHLESARQAEATTLEDRPQHKNQQFAAQTLLARVTEMLTALEVEAEGPEASGEYLSPDEITEQLRPLELQVDSLRHSQNELQRQRTETSGMLADLEGFVGLGVPIERLDDFSFLHFAVGRLPSLSLGEVAEAIGDDVILLPRGTSGDAMRVVAVTSKKGRFALESELEKAGFVADHPAAEAEGLAEDLVEHGRRQLADIEMRWRAIDKVREELAEEHGPRLRLWRRTVENELRILEASSLFGYTDAACVIGGWVPVENVNRVTETVLAETDGRAVIELDDPQADAEPPSKFQHHPLIRPFTMLVSGYGFPGYREIEPTMFVAISFLIMFAFMFGDVGHGGTLLVIGLIMKWRGRKEKIRDVGVILSAAGVASMIMGLLYGSYFGIPHLVPPLWVEPIEDPMTMMLAAILGGTALMSVGLVFNIVNRLRHGDYVHGIFDRFGLVGAVMFWAALWLAVWALWRGPEDLPTGPVIWIMIIGIVMLFLREPLLVFMRRRQGHKAESMLEAVITAFVEIMEVFIGYLANTLSFLRLAAYALSHSALLLATMAMSDVLSQMGPGGRPLAVVMFIVGNLIIIALEGLVAGIQAIRLEWYEFFGKFYSGTGRAYRPFEAD